MSLKKSSSFAVAAYSFDKYSETFIRNHAERILPAKTSLISLDSADSNFKKLDDVSCFQPLPSTRPGCSVIDNLLKLIRGGSVFYPGDIVENNLAKFLVENDVKVLLAEFGPVGCAVVGACKKANVKLYVHFHGYDASKIIKKRHIRYSYKRLERSAAGFIFPSMFLANQLKAIGINDSKFHVAPCCVDTDDFCFTTNKDDNLLLSVGRFVPKKAPHKTILAFSKLLRNFPDLRLEMIGDGDLLPMCQDLVKSLDIENSVVFRGSREHSFIQQRLSRAKLFLQHSVTAPDGDTEGLGVSLLEAMSSGAVVVATRHNGFVETVVEGETGFLVDENDVDAMAQCCLRLLQDEDLLVSMSQKARKRVEEKFTVGHQMVTLRKIMGLTI